MKFIKIISLAAAVFLLLPLLFACVQDEAEAGSEAASEQTEAESSEDSGWVTKETMYYSDKSYDVAGANVIPEGEGIYFFDRSEGLNKTPEQTSDYTDCAVCGGIITAISQNKPIIIPESGFVMRVIGTELHREPELGVQVRYSLKQNTYLPESYVAFGDKIIEIGYRDIVRIDEDTGFLFDEYWYNSTTRSNIYGTEIAVDKDGYVVEVNPSGTESSGNTFIPEGGFVLAVGQGSACETRLKSVAVGDTAVLTERSLLYTVKKYTVNEKNITGQRPDNSIIYYSYGEKDHTSVGSGTDILVGADGIVIDVIPNTKGWNVIPEGGFAICGTGKYATTLANAFNVGDKCFISGVRTLCFASTPETLLDKCITRLQNIDNDYSAAVDELKYVDFEAVDKAKTEAHEIIDDIEKNGLDEANLLNLCGLLDACETELIPCATVGDRAAWVTMGETDYSNNPYLHYYDYESVERTVKYAKNLNLNTLIIDNLASGYAVYDSDIPGLIKSDLLGDFDLIQAFCDACKEYGIRLIVMPGALMSVSSAVNYPEDHYINLYSDCVIKSNKGKTVDGYGAIALDPSQPKVRNLVLDIVTELAEKYPDIYGIQMDYIRYPLPIYYQKDNYEDFGYDSPASEAFKKKYKTDPKDLKTDDALWDEWCAVRREVITSLVKDIYTAVKDVNAELNVSFTCFADYNDRQIYVFQEPEKWAESGIADGIYPMIYASDTESQLKYALQIAEAAEHTDVVLGVGTYVRATDKSISEQLAMPYDLAYAGSSTFTLRYIATCGYNEIYKKAFRNPAVPTGQGAETAEATAKMIADRADKLVYLYKDDSGLLSYRDSLNAFAFLPFDYNTAEDKLNELLDESGINDEKLLAALKADIEYAVRLIMNA